VVEAQDPAIARHGTALAGRSSRFSSSVLRQRGDEYNQPKVDYLQPLVALH